MLLAPSASSLAKYWRDDLTNCLLCSCIKFTRDLQTKHASPLPRRFPALHCRCVHTICHANYISLETKIINVSKTTDSYTVIVCTMCMAAFARQWPIAERELEKPQLPLETPAKGSRQNVMRTPGLPWSNILLYVFTIIVS